MKNWKKNKVFFAIALLLLSLLFEIVVGNFRHWESLTFTKTKIAGYRLEQGLEEIGNNRYRITDPNQAYIDVLGHMSNVKNLYVNISSEDNDAVSVSVVADDSANSAGLELGKAVIAKNIDISRYLRLHLNGRTNYIRIKIEAGKDAIISMEPPFVNQVQPFEFSLGRMLIILLVMLFLSAFSPKSLVYQTDYRIDTNGKKVFIAVFVGIHLLITLLVSQLIMPNVTLQKSIDENGWPAYGQYNELADALMDGQVYLNREPPRSLLNASNPYDGYIRWHNVVTLGGEMFDYDYAYFDGRYYSYFGPVPAVLFFIPYKLVTGMDFRTWDVVTICAILFCLASFAFVYALLKKYYPHASFGMFLLFSSIYYWGSGITYLTYMGIVYSVPIVTSLLFGTMGVTYWLLARENVKLNVKRLVMGAFLIALVMGCRPQMGLIMFLAFPIFWREIVSERIFFSKKGIKNTFAVIVPFMIVGIILMYYNYIRFGSVTDFGANYNLTSNDMTHRGFVFDRIPLGIFVYLFQPFNIVPQYPFMKVVDVSNDYLGFTNTEPLFGGFFYLNAVALFTFLVLPLRKYLKKVGTLGIALASLLFGTVILLLDIQMAGLTQRYMCDFGWLYILAAIIIMAMLESICREKQIERGYYRLVSLLLFGCVALNLWGLLITERFFSLINIRPQLFYWIKSLITF